MKRRFGNKIVDVFSDADYEKDDNKFFAIHAPFGEGAKIFSILGPLPGYADSVFEIFDKFLWLLGRLDRKLGGPFVFIFNSPGGDAGTMFSLLDTMELLESPVYTIARYADSAAAVLCVAGAVGHRYIYPHGRLLLHNARTTYDMDEQEKHYVEHKISAPVADLIMSRCNVDKIFERLPRTAWDGGAVSQAEKIRLLMWLFDSDQFFAAKEAVDCGLVDQVMTKKIAQELLAPKMSNRERLMSQKIFSR